jgi:chemotaxis protein methyltransferase CheR
MNRRLSDADYAAVAAALNRLAGLVFDESRRAGLSAVVRERMVVTSSADVVTYLAKLERADGAAERQRLLDLVTIQETNFFRIVPQMLALRDHLLPELAQRARRDGRPLTIWSAGCSTGEEPYTLAMLLRQVMEQTGPVDARIVGTDVSASALEVARAGRYAGRTVDLARQGGLDRWFDVLDDGSHSVRADVRSLVDFRLHNLVTEAPPFDPATVDLLLCRNVTIYFSRSTTKALVHRFHQTLTVGGYLLVGPAETLWQLSDEYTLAQVGDAFVYRKEVRPPARRGPRPVAERRRGRWPLRRTDLASVGPEPTASPAAQHPAVVATVATRSQPEPNRRLLPSPAAPSAAAVATASALDMHDRARQLLADGDYAGAAQLAQQGAEHADNDQLMVDCYVLRARALINLADDLNAQIALRRAIFLDPYAGHAHFLLGSSLQRMGDSAAAAAAYMAASDSLPRVSTSDLDDLLDGRHVDELVELCRHLAQAALSSPVEAGAAGRSTP